MCRRENSKALIGQALESPASGLQDGVWPNLRPRGTLLHAGLLPRVVQAARAGAPLPAPETTDEARSTVRGDELRLFALAASRARRQLVLSCTSNDDEQPSMLMGFAAERLRPRRRPLHLRGLVGALRRELVASGDHEASAALALLAEEGVPGAHPDDWYGLAAPSTESANAGKYTVRVTGSGLATKEAGADIGSGSDTVNFAY